MSNKVRDFTNIRVFFSKNGNIKYISHLDLYRAMGRAVKRSELPVWITEGFNPHIYITFALPLALGIESHEESMDLRLTQELPMEEVAERLNAAMPPELSVTRVAFPICNANDIAKASYEISGCEEALKKLSDELSKPVVEITKRTKKSVQTLDVKPLLEWDSHGGVLTLPAGGKLNINPWNVLAGRVGEHTLNVKRIAIICQDGRNFE